jgi:protein O-mannosyl-transferase
MKFKVPLLASLAVIITLISFSPVLYAGFTNWDDQIMVTQNTTITSLAPDHLVKMFTSFHERLYHPLVLISYAIEYRFAGLNPHVFHITSLILHLMSTALVFWFIFALCESPLMAFTVSVLFGIHPMHVESVAWIAERKDVLYTLFFIASLVSYTYYVKTKKCALHLVTLILFVMSLMSKSMAMTLPLVLILIDYFLGRKLDKKSVSDKIFFFVLAILFGMLTVLGHYEPGVHGREFSFSLPGNLMLAAQSLVFYIIKLFDPSHLSCLYPMPDQIAFIPAWIFTFSPIILLMLTLIVVYYRKFKPVVFGSLFFFFTVLPVTQILPVGLKVPADRYTYVPYIGFFFILAAGLERLWQRKEGYLKIISILIIAVITITCSYLTWNRAQMWHDSKVLWTDVIKNYKNVPTAYYNMAEDYFLVDWDLNGAIPLFTKAIEADPKYAEAYINRGLVYYYKGDNKMALKDYAAAEKINQNFYELYVNEGNSYNAIGEPSKAISAYNTSLHIKPTPEGFYNRGGIYLNEGRYKEAINDYTKALSLRPNYPDAYNNRGNAYSRLKEMDLAVADFTASIMYLDKNPTAYLNRALIYYQKKEYKKALDDALKAKNLGAKVNEQALENLEKTVYGRSR